MILFVNIFFCIILKRMNLKLGVLNWKNMILNNKLTQIKSSKCQCILKSFKLWQKYIAFNLLS